MSLKDKDARRAGYFGEQQRGGLELDGERVSVSPSTANNSRSTQAAQREPYSKAEADRREREARYRIERRNEQQASARYFCQLQRGCVRRV